MEQNGCVMHCDHRGGVHLAGFDMGHVEQACLILSRVWEVQNCKLLSFTGFH